MFVFTCKCGQKFKVKEEWEGRYGRCHGCGEKVLISKQGSGEDSTAIYEFVNVNCQCGHAFRIRRDLGPQKMKCAKCGHEAIYDPNADQGDTAQATLNTDVKMLSIKCPCGQVNVVREDMLPEAKCQSCRTKLSS